VTAGMLPFVGLVVPNLIALLIGSNARRAIPWVALTGAALVLLCDILARTVRYPYELPIGTILGVVGGIDFVTMLLARTRRVGGPSGHHPTGGDGGRRTPSPAARTAQSPRARASTRVV